MPSSLRAIETLTRAIRASFGRLRAVGDALHADRGITASMRAVMESLAERGAQSVPQMARAKSVSRQHIQVNVDALVAAGLVVAGANPEHKRSPLIDLTAAGRTTFAAMRKREGVVLRRLAAALPAADVATAIRTLEALHARLTATLAKGDDHG